jgi:CRISPR-associated protein Csb1
MKADASRVERGRDGSWELNEKGKSRLSEVNLGMVPPAASVSGVSVRAIQRLAYLNGIGLARLGFAESSGQASDHEVNVSARATLAALAIVADRAAFAGAGVFMRSGCDLVLEGEELTLVRRGGEETPVNITLDEAIATFEAALARARSLGLGWRSGALPLTPQPNLAALIEQAYLRASAEEG